ncbi:marine proteobacterial sortase target protein [Rhodovibrionaceae bacterium A322]
MSRSFRSAAPAASVAPHRVSGRLRRTKGSGLWAPTFLVVLTLALLAVSGVQARSEERGFGLKISSNGQGQDALLLATEIDISVSGPLARTKLRQHFLNPSDSWAEGTYIFPLPDDTAVDRLFFKVGDKRIRGVIQEKQKAKETYEKAKAQGQSASLLEGERPNVFRTSVANIPPNDILVVEIEFQETLEYSAQGYELRFPLVVAHRYSPKPPLEMVKFPQTVDPDGQPVHPHLPVTGTTPAGDIFGPIDPTAQDNPLPRNPVRLTVNLNAGMPLASVSSPSHKISLKEQDKGLMTVSLQEGTVAANQDFVLRWHPRKSEQPQPTLFAEEIDGDSYLLLSLLPSTKTSATPVLQPRELVLVIDTSGSMHGESLEQAKAAVLLALQKLSPRDRLQILHFDDQPYQLFHTSRPVSPDSLAEARFYVEQLTAEGGTEMAPALYQALRAPAPKEFLRQVVFVTDGAVSNEDELFGIINHQLNDARLFTVGIGSAPNGHFMRQAAEQGRGTFTYIGDVGDVQEKMGALLNKLVSPQLINLSLAASDLPFADKLEQRPERPADLYAGEPLELLLRVPDTPLAELQGQLNLSGLQGYRPKAQQWQASLSLADLTDAPGIAALWGRAALEDVTDGLARGQNPETVRQKAVEIALKHQLVSRYTSLVAVDEEELRSQDEDLVRHDIPRHLPEGWDPNKVFGPGHAPNSQAAPPAPVHTFLGTPLLKLAASNGHQTLALPRTATSAPLALVLGIGLITLALGLLALLQRLVQQKRQQRRLSIQRWNLP